MRHSVAIRDLLQGILGRYGTIQADARQCFELLEVTRHAPLNLNYASRWTATRVL